MTLVLISFVILKTTLAILFKLGDSNKVVHQEKCLIDLEGIFCKNVLRNSKSSFKLLDLCIGLGV